MKRLWLAALLPLLAFGWGGAQASTAQVAQEVLRSGNEGRRVVNFWWLPVEYWVESARELKKSGDEIDDIRRLFELYMVIAVIDAEVGADGTLEAATHAMIGPALRVRRNGADVEILRQIDPKVARLVGELSYVLKASLSVLGQGLRIFFLPNIDDDARPVLHGASKGELEVFYSLGSAAQKPRSFLWRAPLTSIAGPTSCPKDGEELEASWKYCPWHGVKLH